MSAVPKHVIDAARRDPVDIISRYVKLTRRGAEYVCCSPFTSEKSPSFTVNEAKGFWHCFSSGKHGDAIDFVMEITGADFREAVEIITGKLPDPQTAVDTSRPGIPKPAVWQHAGMPPDSAEPPSFTHWRLGKAARVWGYRNADGETFGYVARFEFAKPDGCTGKETLPLCWATNTETGEQAWRWLSFGAPRPLYGLDRLAARPDARVLVVEGEKAADAAAAVFPSWVVVSWPGGGKAVKHADFSPLDGRQVTLWPDADLQAYKPPHPRAGDLMAEQEQPGVVAMRDVWLAIRGTAAEVRVVPPLPGAPNGWDLADDPPDGVDVRAYAKAAVKPAADWFEVSGPAPDNAASGPDNATPSPANDNAPRNRKSVVPPPEFGKPVDVFGISAPAPLPLDVLPDQLQAYVADQSDLLGVDASIIGMAALVAAAACVTDSIKLQPKRFDPTWTESARLWFAVVGDPSTRKSPAISKAVRHVKRLDHQMAERNAAAFGEYKYQHEQWKDAKKASKGQPPPPEPEAPKADRLIVEDITVEALSEVLKDNPRGVLTLQDELTGWFASMDAYKAGGKGASKDRAHWLEAYNGGRRSIDRVTRGSLVVPNWSVCIIGGIQPDMIKRIADSMGNDGLLQRFMILCASPAGQGADRLPDMAAMDAYSALFERLARLQGGDQPVTMAEAAHACRERISEYAVRMIAAFDHPHMRAWLGKWDGLFARLALLYHVIDCAGRSVHPANERVSGHTAAKVERLMCGTLLHHAIHFYTEVLDAHDRQEHVRQIARLVLARKMDRITKRDLAQLWKPSRAMEPWEVKTVLDMLSGMDWLAADMTSLGDDGKPRAWIVNPSVHEMFADHAVREVERRQAVVATIREIREAYSVR